MNSTQKINDEIKEKFRMINILGQYGEITAFSFNVNTIVKDKIEIYLNGIDWDNISLDAANHLRNEVFIKDKGVFRDWNKYSTDARNFIKDHIITNIHLDLSQEVISYNRWDLIHLVLYFQFKLLLNINIIDFYEKEFLIYRDGHFPCGWIGNYPNGTFSVV